MSDSHVRQQYEKGFRALLCRVRQRHIQRGIERLLVESERLASRERLSVEESLKTVFLRTRERVIQRLLRARGWTSEGTRQRCKSLLELTIPATISGESPDFHCDAGLGGLTGWLRIAGYDATYWPGIDDDELLRTVQSQPAIMLTTDRRLMQRGIIEWGAIAARLVSIRLTKGEQFIDLVQRLSLPLRSPRCMTCGGSLAPVDKESVKERIPPRTYPWLDDYYICRRCNRLLWKGTHWERIRSVLDRARAASESSSPG